MPTITLSKKDLSTVSKIVASKAMEMHKKGATWFRSMGGNEEILTCVDIGNIANKLQKPLGSQYDFDKAFSAKVKKSKPR